MRDMPRRAEPPVFSSSARRLAKRASAKRRKISPRTGVEYCPAFSPEFARNWSAASQRRFSRVWLAVSFSDGATQRTVISSFPTLLQPCASELCSQIGNVIAGVKQSASENDPLHCSSAHAQLPAD